MKRLFKAFYIAIFTLILLFFGAGCSLRTKAIVKDINENTNLEIDLLTKVEDNLFDENYDIIPGFGITGYFNKKYGENYMENSDIIDACSVIYHVTAYPDAMFGKAHVTGIQITDPDIHFYGFNVGDSAADFESFLIGKNYKIFDKSERLIKFEKGKVEIRIGINYEEQTVRSIYVGVDTTNIFGIVY